MYLDGKDRAMSRYVALALLLLGWTVPAVRGQMAFTRDMVPSQMALERLGLERNWSGVVPLGPAGEKVILISLAGDRTGDMLFAQTDQAKLHAYDARTGRYLWGADLGRSSLSAQPVAINSDSVFATNFRSLFRLDRQTGRKVWDVVLESAPSSPTAADEEHVMVGLVNGKLVGYTIRDHSKDKPPGFSAATNVFNWQTRNTITGRPIPADKVVAFGSEDGRAYVAQLNPKLLIFRFLTGGAIKASMGTLGARTLLIPSTDSNFYAIDLYTAETRWIYPSGAPINQEPLVARGEIFLLNSVGDLARLNPDDGTPRWTVNIRRAQILAVSPTRIYGFSANRDLAFIDRETGKLLASPRDTTERAGLNLREFALSLTNHLDDRLFFCTPTGLLVSFREQGRLEPVKLRDPNELPFGYLPEQSDEPTPPASPSPEGTPPDEAADAPLP
jgi:outer membrane protein assembly factor BamB